MLNLRQKFGHEFTNGNIDCVDGNGDGNCALGDSYGNGVLAINVLSVIFNSILVMMVIYKWFKARKMDVSNRATMHGLFGMVSLSVMLAVATAGYNIYVQQNFGKELNAGNFGAYCPSSSGVSGCTKLEGSSGNAVFGTNIATAVTSGLVMLFYSGVFFNRATHPTHPLWDKFF
jgi:hypothetical protein